MTPIGVCGSRVTFEALSDYIRLRPILLALRSKGLKSEKPPNTSRGDGELVRQLEECKEQIRELNSAKLDLEEEVYRLTEELHHNDGSRIGRDDEMHYLQNEKDKLERELRYIETDLERCKDTLNREKQANVDLEEDLKAAKRANRELSRLLEDCRQEIVEYRRQIAEQNNQLLNKHKDNLESRVHMQARDKEVSKLQKEYEGTARLRQDLEEEVRNLTEELLAVAAEGDSVRMELSEAHAAIESLQHKVDENERDYDAMKKYVATLESQLQEKSNTDEAFLAEVSGKVQKWKNLLVMKEAELAERDQEIARLQASINSFNSDQQQLMHQQQRVRDYDESSIQSVKTAIQDRDVVIGCQQQTIASLQREIHLLTVDIGKIEEGNKAGDTRNMFRENAALNDEIASLRDKLEVQQRRHSDEQAAAEQDRQELMQLRSRMDEYERGVYGLADAMSELRKEKAKVQLRDKDIVRLNTLMNRLEETLDKAIDENRLLRARAGMPSNETLDTTEIKLRDRLEVERLKAINKHYESEIRDLEQERARLKAALRLQAVQDGENFARTGLPYHDTMMIDEISYKIREDGENNAPKDYEQIHNECLRLKALLQKSSQALSVAQMTNQELQEKLAAKHQQAATPLPPERDMETEKHKVHLKLKQDNERMIARIAFLEEALRSSSSDNLHSSHRGNPGSINQQFSECLQELASKDQLIETLQSQLKVFREQFQLMVDQRQLLYSDYIKAKEEHKQNVDKLEKQVSELCLENEDSHRKELENLVETLKFAPNSEGSEEKLREKAVSLTHALILARMEASVAQRRSAYTESEHGLMSQQNAVLNGELVEMERVLKERISWLELSYENTSNWCTKLQNELEHLVSEDTMAVLMRKHALLVQQHKEALLREQERATTLAAYTQYERESKLLHSRTQELELALTAATTKLTNLERALQDNAHTNPTTLKLAGVEAALDNAERQAQLAKSRERSSRDSLQELEERTKQLEQRVVEQAHQIQTLSQSEVDLKNALVGTMSREEVAIITARSSQIEDECKQLKLEVKKYKELADIASAQSASTIFNSTLAAQEAEMLRKTIRDLQGVASGAGADQALLVADLHQQLVTLQRSEQLATHTAEQTRVSNQRLVIAYKKKAQRLSELLVEWLEYRRAQHGRVSEYLAITQEMQIGERWVEKLGHLLASYRWVERQMNELQHANIALHEQIQTLESKLVVSEAKTGELQQLVDHLKDGLTGNTLQSTEREAQIIDLKLEQLAFKRQLTAAKEKIVSTERLNETLENSVRRQEEQSLRDELLWEQRARALVSQLRDMELQLATRIDISMPPELSLQSALTLDKPHSEQVQDMLHKLEEAERKRSSQSDSLIALNTTVLTLNAKLRVAEDRIADKDAQIHDLNTKLAKTSLLEVTSVSLPPPSEIASTTELQTLQTLYQHSCETIEALRRMIVNKEDSLLKYQQLVIELRETHSLGRQKLEKELQDIKERVHSTSGEQATLTVLRGDLERINGSSSNPFAHPPVAQVNELLNAKEVAALEATAQLETALRDLAVLKAQAHELEHQCIVISENHANETGELRNKYATQLASINAQNENMHHELSQIRAQFIAAQQRNKELEATVEHEVASSHAFSRRVAQLEDQLAMKEKRMQSLQSSVSTLQCELTNLALPKNSTIIPAPIETFDLQTTALEARIGSLQSALTKMRTTHTALVATETQLQKELGRVKQEKLQLEQEVMQLKNVNQRASEELQLCKRQLKLQGQELDQAKVDLETSFTKIAYLGKHLQHSTARSKQGDPRQPQQFPNLTISKPQKQNTPKSNIPTPNPPATQNAYEAATSDEDEPSRDQSDKLLEPKSKSLSKTKNVNTLLPVKQSITKGHGKDATEQKHSDDSELKKAQALSKWEAEKRMQKKIDVIAKQLAEKIEECAKGEQQIRQLREHNAKLSTDCSEWERKFNALKLQQRSASFPLATDIEHVAQLKEQIFKLHEDKDQISRELLIKDEEIHALNHDKVTLAKQCNSLNVMLKSFHGDLGSKNLGENKELIDHIHTLVEQATKHAETIIERDNTIMELRFDREELTHKLTRLQARIADLEALNAFYSKKQPGDTEPDKLPGVVSALKRVINKLKSENAELRKATPAAHGNLITRKEDDVYKQLAERHSSLQKENEYLRNELSAFDPAFFEEIEALKHNYQSALKKIVYYEEKLKKMGESI